MPRRPQSHRPSARARPPDPRPSSAARGYGHAWRAFRLAYLAEHPLCVRCLPRLVPAVHVDHVRPVTGPDDPTFFAAECLQALCSPCHSAKTAAEDGGFGHAATEG